MDSSLNLPTAKSTLLGWAREHPSLAQELQDFVQSRMDLLKQYKTDAARRRNAGEKIEPKPEEPAIERRYYETMLKVLGLALNIDPNSENIRAQLAVVEEFFGNFESAHLRLTELIDAARARADRNNRDGLIDWTISRSRIEILWAAELRRQGNAASLQRALRTQRTRRAALLRTAIQKLPIWP